MLILKFDKHYIRDDIDYVLKEKFPNISYEKHNTENEIIDICLDINNFKSIQLKAFDHDISFLDFEYTNKCHICNKEVKFNKLICGKCNNTGKNNYLNITECDSGDWIIIEGRINDEEIYESGHSIPDFVWIDLLKKRDINVTSKTISDDEMEKLC